MQVNAEIKGKFQHEICALVVHEKIRENDEIDLGNFVTFCLSIHIKTLTFDNNYFPVLYFIINFFSTFSLMKKRKKYKFNLFECTYTSISKHTVSEVCALN